VQHERRDAHQHRDRRYRQRAIGSGYSAMSAAYVAL
jgi:hypothetical protein